MQLHELARRKVLPAALQLLGLSPYYSTVGKYIFKLGNDLVALLKALFSRLSPNGHVYIGGAGGVVTNGFQPGNYVESTGSTYASTDGPVGLVLDAAGSVGSELCTVVGSTLTTTSTTDMPALVIGDTYRVSAVVNKTSGAQIDIGVQNSAYGWQSGTPTSVTANGVTNVSYVFKASDTVGRISALYTSAAGTVTLLSCKRITGIHASQATVGSKPMLRKGIVNLLLNSNAPATQTVSLSVGTYTLSLIGTGSIVITGMGSGTLTGTGASDHVTLTFSVAVAGSVVFTKAGSVTQFGLYLGALTAAQILAYGGIPLTTTAAASSTLGPQYLAFDGVDDSLGSTFAAGTLGSNCDVFMTVRRDSATKCVLAYPQGGRFIGVVESGSSSGCMDFGGATYSIYVDGVQVGINNSVARDQMHNAITVGLFHVVEFRNLDLSSWTGFAFGNYPGFTLKGAIAHVSITPALTDSERTLMRTQAAKAAGGRVVAGAFVSDF